MIDSEVIYTLAGIVLGSGGVFGLIKFQTSSFLKIIHRGLDLQAEHFTGLQKTIEALTNEVKRSVEQQIRIYERLNGG